jgi:hypothetical protein
MSDADNILDYMQQKMLEAEEEVLLRLPTEYSLEELVNFFHSAHLRVLDSAETIEGILQHRREYSQEGIFSTFRILHAVLAEIEYRIRENKI